MQRSRPTAWGLSGYVEWKTLWWRGRTQEADWAMETWSDGSWIEDPKVLKSKRAEGEEVSHTLPRSQELGAIPVFKVCDDHVSG
jgi:hypothetical protein